MEIADTIGALPIVLEIPYLEHEAAQNNTEASLRLLRAHQLLSDRILLALLDVKSAAAEADCEEERADQLADRLQEQRDIQTRRLTIFAILGGGVLGILSGGLAWAAPASVGQGIAGVAAGTVESSLGTAALFDDTQYHFQHSRNLLQEVWEGPAAPSLLPSSVWRFLNRPLREGSTMRTLRETLIARWHQDGRFDKPGSETELRRVALFFGAGGLYKIEELRARAAMLDRLEADINLMSHDLERLMRETLTRDPVLSPILR